MPGGQISSGYTTLRTEHWSSLTLEGRGEIVQADPPRHLGLHPAGVRRLVRVRVRGRHADHAQAAVVPRPRPAPPLRLVRAAGGAGLAVAAVTLAPALNLLLLSLNITRSEHRLGLGKTVTNREYYS